MGGGRRSADEAMGFDLCGRKVHVLRDTGGGVTSAGRYRDVFAVGEFRALFGAGLLSLFGDQLARVAVTVLVFSRTGSTLLAAATFGLSYVTWVIAGPLLSVVADRLPRRTVMVACDVARIGLLGLLALPGLPILVMIGLLVVAALLEPPFRAARSAMLAEILHGDLLVVGNGLVHLWTQLAQVVGFAAGGAIVAMLSARGAILVDAATFAASAALIRVLVGHRAVAGVRPDQGWLAMVGDGFRLVFADRVLRSYLVLAWVGSSATAAPEGLMVSLAGQLHGGSRATGILLAAMPLGTVIGVVLYARVTSPARRRRLVRPMALLSCLALVPLWGGPFADRHSGAAHAGGLRRGVRGPVERAVRAEGPGRAPGSGVRRGGQWDDARPGSGHPRGRGVGRGPRRSCCGDVAVWAGRRCRDAAGAGPLA